MQMIFLKKRIAIFIVNNERNNIKIVNKNNLHNVLKALKKI